MGKKLVISEQQYHLLKEQNELSEQLPQCISSAIDGGKTPFSNLSMFSFGATGALKKLAMKGYSNAIDSFVDDVTKIPNEKVQNKLVQLISKCQKKEDVIKEQLEKICCCYIKDNFSKFIDDNFSVTAELVSEIGSDTQFHIQPDKGGDIEYDDTESMEVYKKESEKRTMVNTLALGLTAKLYNQAVREVLPSVFELDEELPHLYSRIVKINDYLLYTNDVEITDNNNSQCGYEQLIYSGNEDSGYSKVRLESKGILFPFLLSETIRGFVEYVINSGLPEDKAMTDFVIDECDVLSNEPWYTRIGVVLWDGLCEKCSCDEPDAMVCALANIAQLDVESFSMVMKEIVANTKKGRDYAERIFNDAKKEVEYNSFEDDITAKSDDDDLDILISDATF